MTGQRIPWIAIGVIVLWIANVGTLAGQGAVQPEPAVPDDGCTRPFQCPPPFAFPHVRGINLKPSGGVCKFEQRDIERLELNTGENVSWQFCNECAQNMVVQLDTSFPSPGPFKAFQFFIPLPQSDNLVTVNVACRDYGTASGTNAQTGGSSPWKYSLRAKRAEAVGFGDEIDPELVIDEFFVPPNLRTPGWALLAALVGAILGYWLARRARSAF